MAGDGSFKTFQAAYPYVVRKLLSDNSLETRKVLHQVLLLSQLLSGVACMVKFMLLIASLFRQLPLVTRNHL
jgi:hypothetical protein